MGIIAHAQPRCVLIENVEGFVHGGLRLLRAEFRAINKLFGTNYQPVWKILNAADYGVPQLRKRFFLVAFRDGRDFEFPSPTHAHDRVTCWDAIGPYAKKDRSDLALKGRWARLLPSIPEGKNYLWHTNRGGGEPLFGWRTKYWSFLLKLAKNQPAWTIPAQPAQNAGPFHWSNRQLRTSELLRIQTFPKNFFVSGNRIERQSQIGNAVPPLLAEVIGRTIAAVLNERSEPKKKYKLAIPHRRATPKPSRVYSLDKGYLRMIGRHRDHPGTGLGPASKKPRRPQTHG